MKIIGVIPARYASTRFPGKPLADIHGKPMIWWVYQQIKKVPEFDEIYVATDDDRIENTCASFGMSCVRTSSEHETSTQRVYEVAQKIAADVYVCINGDEPLIDPGIIRKVIPDSTLGFYARNLMGLIMSPVEVVDTTNIKVVVDSHSNALFMSRSPIPYPKSSMQCDYYKHLGVLAYCFDALEFFSTTAKGYNERIEDINELRFIENGKKLKMIPVKSESLSVDTPKDLEHVRLVIAEKIKRGEIIL